MRTRLLVLSIAALVMAGCANMSSAPGKRQLILVANDEKQNWDDAGRVVLSPHGKDSVSIVDIGTDPLAPKIVVNLPLDNTIAGPPVNLAITPDEAARSPFVKWSRRRSPQAVPATGLASAN